MCASNNKILGREGGSKVKYSDSGLKRCYQKEGSFPTTLTRLSMLQSFIVLLCN